MADIKTTSGEQIALKYAPFNIIDVAYKHVNNIPIPASILIPKNLPPGEHPVIVRWHGGGFGTGHRLYADWYGDWTLSLALKTSAIQVSPDYRLMPESKGLDILQDLRDFYTWLLTHLPSHLPSNITPNLTRILVTGESAGGWLTLQSGFLIPDRIGAIISHYPMADLRDRHFTEHYEKIIDDPPVPQLDPKILNDYIEKIEPGSIVTSRTPPTGQELVMTIFQQGWYPKYFGTERELHPLEVLEDVESFPPTWLLHGTKDTIVPVGSSEKFAEKLKERFPDVPVHLTLVEGEEHGFDLHDKVDGKPASLEGTGWVREGCEWLEKWWPGR